ncbi:MAG: CRISPR-associated endoribonuclease Cas6 [Candidatus Methanoculleus thermohydrogenotrophicum]
MRLLLKLQAAADQKNISLDYNKLQGFVYRLLHESGYPGIHDKEGYKYFSFSNVFPYDDMKEGDIRNFILASPNNNVIETIAAHLITYKDKPIHIGDCSFALRRVDKFNYTLPPAPVRIISATPIIIRIPEYNYDRYNVPATERMPRYVYWRPAISFDAFVKQLSENLIKKYNDYYGTEIATTTLFEQFFFRKPVYTRIIIDGKSYGVAASMWEFFWSHMTPIQKQIIGFGLNTGFGERNSFGFGFVNIANPRKPAGSTR